MAKFLLSTLLVLVISAGALSFPGNPGLTRADGDSTAIIEGKISLLAGLIYQRLALSKDVAAWKSINKVPIEDIVREEEIIKYQVQSAVQMNLDTALVKNFFLKQIKASKIIQNYYINIVFKDSVVTEANDLEYVTRPAINHINNHMLLAVRDIKDYLQQEKWRVYFENEIRQRINNLNLQNTRVKNSLIFLLIKLN
ncbi:MAG: gamma subclass chorismate mutase AroQ [Ignavibacteriaceae bacterium]